MGSETTHARQQLASLLEARSQIEVRPFLVEVPGASPEQEQAVQNYVMGCVTLMRRFGDALQAAIGDAALMDALESDDHPELEVNLPGDFAAALLAQDPDLDLRSALSAYLEQKAGGSGSAIAAT